MITCAGETLDLTVGLHNVVEMGKGTNQEEEEEKEEQEEEEQEKEEKEGDMGGRPTGCSPL